MFRSDADLFERERQLRVRAGQVMQELQAAGEDWQAAWCNHPVAREYRELLRDAWTRPAQKGKA